MRRWPRPLPWRGQPAARLVLGRRVGPEAGLPFAARPVVLRDQEIHQHKHVIGLTGQGKSKLLASLFVQLHSQGIGCGLIDPHSDLALDCLRLLAEDGRLERPEDRARLWYVDLGRRDAYLPFNILAGGGDDPHAVARRLVEVCTRAWPALANGTAPTFENILLHAVVVLVENGLPLTLLERTLTDKTFRDMSLRQVHDQQVVRFFQERYDRWGREGAIMRESTLNRAALLTFSPALRYCLGQPENRLDFKAHLDQGISVIYNLGGLDEETQRFLGALLLVGYETAALARADQPAAARRPWHLIVDEFSLFTTRSEETLTHVLSMARKFGLFFTLAHQTWSQLPERLQGALQNTLAIAFKLGRSDAEWAARRFGRYESHAVKHEVADPSQVERTHPVFFSVPETFERWTTALEELRPREAYLKHDGQAIKLRTIAVPAAHAESQRVEQLIEEYRDRLLRPAERVMAEVDGQLAREEAPNRRTRRVALATSHNHGGKPLT